MLAAYPIYLTISRGDDVLVARRLSKTTDMHLWPSRCISNRNGGVFLTSQSGCTITNSTSISQHDSLRHRVSQQGEQDIKGLALTVTMSSLHHNLE